MQRLRAIVPQLAFMQLLIVLYVKGESMSHDMIRLISASKRDFVHMTPADLKLSIQKSEGRAVMGQHCLINAMGRVLYSM